MLRRVIGRSLRVRRGRTLIALGALSLAAALITTMLALYSDLERKLDKEFRGYGANIVVTAKTGTALPADAEQRVRLFVPQAQIVPTALSVATARRKDGTINPVVVVGADLDSLRKLNSWWKIAGESRGVLVGQRAAKLLDSKEPLQFGGRALAWNADATVQSGGADDDRIFVNAADFSKWTKLSANAIEISFTGSAADTQAALQRLQQAFGTEADVRPVRQIVEAEAHVIRKTRAMMLACGLLIAVTVAMCVTSTLTASVLERRRDFALMKALGASQGTVNAIFAFEAALLGAVAAVFGFGIGAALASLIGRINFHESIMPTAVVFPSVLLASAAIALIASALPLMRLRRLQPAVILKGE